MSHTIPTEISSVTVLTKANVYFDGRVVSHTLKLTDGTKKTLGLIYSGEYHFGTTVAETMEIISGSCRVKIDGTDSWNEYESGSFFKVPGHHGFSIVVATGITEYLCSYE